MLLVAEIAIWILASGVVAFVACRCVNGRLAQAAEVPSNDSAAASDAPAADETDVESAAPTEEELGSASDAVPATAAGGASSTEVNVDSVPDSKADAEPASDAASEDDPAATPEPEAVVVPDPAATSQEIALPLDESDLAPRNESDAPAVPAPYAWSRLTVVLAVLCLGVTGAAAYKVSVNAPDCRAYLCALLCYVATLASALTDAKLRLIFNEVSIGLLAARALLYGYEFVAMSDVAVADLVSSVVGCVASFAVLVLAKRLSRGGVGGGDVKLIAAIGFVGGIEFVVWVTLFALVAASAVALVLMATKRRDRKDSLPFAPFVYLGLSCVLLFLL